ncbi:unnamed protein product [Camellia sinensis]
MVKKTRFPMSKQKNKNTSSVAAAHNSLVSEPGMEEHRLGQLEIDVNSLPTGQERMMKEMQEMFAAMNTRLDNIMTNQVRDPGESSHNQNQSVGGRTLGSGGTNREVRSNSAPQYLPKTVKLDFPCFNGIENPTSWVCWAEQFYYFHQTPEADRVPLASFNLEDDAQLWYQLLKEETPIISWEDFKQGLLNRYGPTQFQDFFASPLPIKRLSPAELHDRRSKGRALQVKLCKQGEAIGPWDYKEVRNKGENLKPAGFLQPLQIPTQGKNFKFKWVRTSQVEAVDQELRHREPIIKELQNRLNEAQQRMKKFYDAHRTDRNFNVGDFVYLKLQPYRQVSLALRRNLKLSPKYYGPFEILNKIGPVAYKLKLPENSRLHPVFHVSLLKKKVGMNMETLDSLPIIPEEGNTIVPLPQAILNQRKKKNREEVLVHWQGLSPSDATWENLAELRLRFPEATLEDKGVV